MLRWSIYVRIGFSSFDSQYFKTCTFFLHSHIQYIYSFCYWNLHYIDVLYNWTIGLYNNIYKPKSHGCVFNHSGLSEFPFNDLPLYHKWPKIITLGTFSPRTRRTTVWRHWPASLSWSELLTLWSDRPSYGAPGLAHLQMTAQCSNWHIFLIKSSFILKGFAELISLGSETAHDRPTICSHRSRQKPFGKVSLFSLRRWKGMEWKQKSRKRVESCFLGELSLSLALDFFHFLV